MKDINITISAGGNCDVFIALQTGVTIAKALKVEWISVNFYDKFSIMCHHDSNVQDLFQIHQLEIKRIKK